MQTPSENCRAPFCDLKSSRSDENSIFEKRGAGRRIYLLLHARACSHRGYDPDGSSGDGPLSGVHFMEFSRFSRRSRVGVSGFTDIFLDRHTGSGSMMKWWVGAPFGPE
ncbi:hypothetical protein EVAR_96631_1 [Eumeta japonica]|uniref:Uncharacterized protein n=1 Tax=Eumeta variegata TaxID=151549 RepID=A0A4C1WSK6_EUMVA|nr:hypothetical protein EVAR_96631_1 [Eumeta japonica]